jgi:surface carbohydrate biosynthesis protein
MIFKLISFSIPRKAEILIYDTAGYEFYSEYLKKFKIEKLFLRKESVNLYCLLYSIFKKIYTRDSLKNIYIDCFINLVKPKLIITWTDNNLHFYSISKKHKGTKTVFIQNGTRVEIGDIFSSLNKSDKKKYHVDYMCVMNNKVGELFKNYISGDTLVVGSIINNKKKLINKNIKNNIIVFISQFNPYAKSEDLIDENNSSFVNWGQFFETDKRVLINLANWCQDNNKFIHIAGRTNNIKENEFFNDVLKTYKCWKFFPKINFVSSYSLINKAQCTVSICSTLGVEALARGFRVIFISRKPELKLKSSSFGWPNKFSEEGFFWTNLKEPESTNKLLSNVTNCSDVVWKKETKPFLTKLMHYDYGNKNFKKIINQLLK